jgi:hypothetical protein
VSENECSVSAHIAILPVNNAAISLDSAMPILPNRAAYTAFLDRSFNYCYYIINQIYRHVIVRYYNYHIIF